MPDAREEYTEVIVVGQYQWRYDTSSRRFGMAENTPETHILRCVSTTDLFHKSERA